MVVATCCGLCRGQEATKVRLLVSPLEVHFRPDVVWFRAKTANELIEWELSTYSSRYCTKPVLLFCFPNSSFVNHDVGEHLSLSLSCCECRLCRCCFRDESRPSTSLVRVPTVLSDRHGAQLLSRSGNTLHQVVLS